MTQRDQDAFMWDESSYDGQGPYGGDYGWASQLDARRARARPDQRLKEDLAERIMYAWDIDPSEVSLEVQDGKVTLGGAVPEPRMKHAIEDIVDNCPGVQAIENRLRVRNDPQT